jgi:hypothetical protein
MDREYHWAPAWLPQSTGQSEVTTQKNSQRAAHSNVQRSKLSNSLYRTSNRFRERIPWGAVPQVARQECTDSFLHGRSTACSSLRRNAVLLALAQATYLNVSSWTTVVSLAETEEVTYKVEGREVCYTADLKGPTVREMITEWIVRYRGCW